SAALLGLAPGTDEGGRRAALAAAVDAGRVPTEHEAVLADLLGLPQRADLQPLFEAMDNATRLARSAEVLARLATQAARAQPRLLVFEDIHWAAPSLLACLAALTQATRSAPLVLAMTTRFEGDPIGRAWRAASHGTPLLSIDMGPLTLEEARRLVGGMMAASERYALQCIERAEGNPLFLEQLLRNALEGEAAQVPPTIQSLVLARIDRLAPRDKQALQAASVLGKRVDAEALAGLLDDGAYRCDALLAADLLRPEGGDFLFAHALIQEGVYASLLNVKKRELHLRAARWYRAREPALHAEHLDRAQHPDAAAAYLAAAQDETRHYRHDAAVRLAGRGAELAAGGPLACALELVAGDVLRRLARTHESVAAFERALAAARDDAERSRAWLGIAAGHRVTGDTARGMQALSEAQPIARRLDDAGALARIHNLRGNLCFALGRIDDCGREHALALEHAERAGDLEAQATALSGLGDHAYAGGRMLTALGHFRRCVELCRRIGSVRSEIVNTCMVGHCLNWTGQGDAGLAEVRHAAEQSAKVGVPQTDVMALESVAMVLTLRGDYAEAEPALERAIASARRASARRFLSIDLMLLAQCRLHAGRRAEARALLGEALQIARETGIGFIGPGIVAALALASDDACERRRWLEEGETMLAGDCVLHARTMFHRDAIDALLDAGDDDAVLRQADALEALDTGEPMIIVTLGAARARTLVALRREGPRPEIVERLRVLAAEARRGGMGSMARGIDLALGSD
ncbi:MAG: tetratricopeptide repeat protein, partial [Betaproteobacteria bacterium]